MTVNNIYDVVTDFKSKSNAKDRFTSFDYCYNYFLRTKSLTDDVEKSCLVLGFYLASWGMFRGSSFLLQKSVKCFEPTIQYISTLDKSVWKIDVDNYDSDNIKIMQNIYTEVKKRLVHNDNADLTLITKILLGIFGFVPAFDNYFCETFRNLANGQCGFRKLNMNSLIMIKKFYEANKESVDNLSKQTFTLDFTTGQKTTINYPKAKIIDMYGFMTGFTKSRTPNLRPASKWTEIG